LPVEHFNAVGDPLADPQARYAGGLGQSLRPCHVQKVWAVRGPRDIAPKFVHQLIRIYASSFSIIADQTRLRRDLHPLRSGDETVTDLKILTGRRTDLVADRPRAVNRLRAQFTDIFP